MLGNHHMPFMLLSQICNIPIIYWRGLIEQVSYQYVDISVKYFCNGLKQTLCIWQLWIVIHGHYDIMGQIEMQEKISPSASTGDARKRVWKFLPYLLHHHDASALGWGLLVSLRISGILLHPEVNHGGQQMLISTLLLDQVCQRCSPCPENVFGPHRQTWNVMLYMLVAVLLAWDTLAQLQVCTSPGWILNPFVPLILNQFLFFNLEVYKPCPLFF